MITNVLPPFYGSQCIILIVLIVCILAVLLIVFKVIILYDTVLMPCVMQVLLPDIYTLNTVYVELTSLLYRIFYAYVKRVIC